MGVRASALGRVGAVVVLGDHWQSLDAAHLRALVVEYRTPSSRDYPAAREPR